MRFGSKVLITRGSPGNPPGTPGCLRQVGGILVRALGKQRTVRLTEDDPLATVGYCTKAGDVGQWSRSQVKDATKHTQPLARGASTKGK